MGNKISSLYCAWKLTLIMVFSAVVRDCISDDLRALQARKSSLAVWQWLSMHISTKLRKKLCIASCSLTLFGVRTWETILCRERTHHSISSIKPTHDPFHLYIIISDSISANNDYIKKTYKDYISPIQHVKCLLN